MNNKHKVANVSERAGWDGTNNNGAGKPEATRNEGTPQRPVEGVSEASQTVPPNARIDGDLPDGTTPATEGTDMVKVSCITDTTVVQDFGIFPTNNDDSDNRTLLVPRELWEEYVEKKGNFKDVEERLINLWGQNGQ